ncbi:nucleoside triphosphate pyrophosphatase [Saccharibacillus sp. JS10]|uniref:Maf family protein n=1 Tax=Saccharibacillus sp. JS10 TaxID=2950552 RepID=UPI00210BD021|nr:Maf family protein [Saccharibacillus sp. JS10]MCQ4088175.1 Maf family protein [Saccharibacillus sp. JS10]
MSTDPKRLILASSSPRRRELLSLLNIPFEVNASDTDESVPDHWTPQQIVQELALRKARAIISDTQPSSQDAIVIGSDTIVVQDGVVLGKPKDANDAKRMLNLLSGSTHQVYTGVACIDLANQQELCQFSQANVTMRILHEYEIEAYIAGGEPMDKAGSYAVQGLGAVFVEKIEGDYHTIVGLPIGLLYQMLQQFGIHALSTASKIL